MNRLNFKMNLEEIKFALPKIAVKIENGTKLLKKERRKVQELLRNIPVETAEERRERNIQLFFKRHSLKHDMVKSIPEIVPKIK